MDLYFWLIKLFLFLYLGVLHRQRQKTSKRQLVSQIRLGDTASVISYITFCKLGNIKGLLIYGTVFLVVMMTYIRTVEKMECKWRGRQNLPSFNPLGSCNQLDPTGVGGTLGSSPHLPVGQIERCWSYPVFVNSFNNTC